MLGGFLDIHWVSVNTIMSQCISLVHKSMAAASSLMYVKTIPCQEITEDFENNHITIPMHEKKIKIEIDEFHLDESILVEKSLAVHLGLSIIEHILLRCPSIKYWLKNQMYPIHHIIFHDEVVSLFIDMINFIRLFCFD